MIINYRLLYARCRVYKMKLIIVSVIAVAMLIPLDTAVNSSALLHAAGPAKFSFKKSTFTKVEGKQVINKLRTASRKLKSLARKAPSPKLKSADKKKYRADIAKINSVAKQIDNEIAALQKKLSKGDDAQLSNLELQNTLQKQQETLKLMSNIAKTLHDTAMGIIRKIGG